MAFPDFLNIVLVRKNNHFAEFKVYLIHRKQVPLLHNTVLILYDEEAGLVAVIMTATIISFYKKFAIQYMYKTVILNKSYLRKAGRNILTE